MMKSSFILETQELGRRLENRWIWKDLNLKVEAGSRIVLKGPTGSGKTLLLRVLAGLENPDHGKVFFQERDQNQWKMPEYRTQVALLPQRPAFQEGSVEHPWELPLLVGLVMDWIFCPGSIHDGLDCSSKCVKPSETTLPGHLLELPDCSTASPWPSTVFWMIFKNSVIWWKPAFASGRVPGRPPMTCCEVR